MNGVQFGAVHSYSNLNLLLTKKEIGSPTIKTREIEIEGRDSVLDLTEFFGGVNYGNRKLKFEFSTLETLDSFTEIQNALYINNEYITGHASNNALGTGASGITYTNNAFVLRYVIGV